MNGRHNMKVRKNNILDAYYNLIMSKVEISDYRLNNLKRTLNEINCLHQEDVINWYCCFRDSFVKHGMRCYLENNRYISVINIDIESYYSFTDLRNLLSNRNVSTYQIDQILDILKSYMHYAEDYYAYGEMLAQEFSSNLPTIKKSEYNNL